MTRPPTSQRPPFAGVVSGFPQAGGSFAAPPSRRLRHAVLFTAAFLIPISRELNLGGKNANFGAADPLVAMVGLWLLWRLLTQGIRLPLGGLFLLNVAAVGVATLYNQETALNSQGPIGILVWLAKTPFLWLSFYLVANLVDDRRDFFVFLRGWLFASVMVAGTGMYGSLSFQYTGVHNMFANWYRAQGTLNDCNAYAMYLALSFFLACVYLRLTPGRRHWVFVVMAIQLAGFSFSGSRGGTFAFIAALLAWWFLSTSIKQKVVSATAVAALVLTVVSLPQWDAYASSNPIFARLTKTTVDLGSSEISDRRLLWDEAIADFLDSPVVGIGRGNLGQHKPTGPVYGYGVAHNTLLGLLGEVRAVRHPHLHLHCRGLSVGAPARALPVQQRSPLGRRRNLSGGLHGSRHGGHDHQRRERPRLVVVVGDLRVLSPPLHRKRLAACYGRPLDEPRAARRRGSQSGRLRKRATTS